MRTPTRRPRNIPYTAYLSSTLSDLRGEREVVQQALRDKCVVTHSYRADENDVATSCLKDVAGCNLYIGIFGMRYGHVPSKGISNPKKLSIVELEYRHAIENDIPCLIFIKNEDNIPLPKSDVRTKEHPSERIEQLRTHLATEHRPALFGTLEELKSAVIDAFSEFKEKHQENRLDDSEPEQTRDNAGIRATYLDWLQDECERVVLLAMNSRERQNARLGESYVPAVTHPRQRETPESRHYPAEQRPELLLHRLASESLYVPGAPGAGKSTFCRWLALCITQGAIPSHTISSPEGYEETLAPELAGLFPFYCRLREWADNADAPYLEGNGQWRQKRLEESLAAWLDAVQPGGMTGAAFRDVLKNGKCLLILDGIDEVPEAIGARRPRRNLLTGLSDAIPQWHKLGHRILLTSRPYGVDSTQRRSLRLAQGELIGLPDELQALFIRRWYAANGTRNGASKAEGLLEHLWRRPDLNELRPNPMLLTALCVKYDEGQRLPGDIYHLYDSVVDQVLYKRFDTEPDRHLARRRLEAVALRMHGGLKFNPSTVPAPTVAFDDIDQALAEFAHTDPTTETGGVEVVVRREILLSNSGLLLPGGDKSAAFYHLSFQEFLAAERLRRLQVSPVVLLEHFAANPHWRRTLTFLFAALATGRPERALEAFAPLREHLRPDAIKRDARPALLLASCLELGHARKWNLESFAAPLQGACDALLESDDLEARADLWAALGTLGFDRRPGVGLKTSGVPDIVWCKVPSGRVKLEGHRKKFEVGEFYVSRYPVTYVQYRQFLLDPTGYSNASWWQSMEREETPGVQTWPIVNHPAETVSWYDAIAFCRWLGAKLGYEVRLPTEWEWQHAAMSASPRCAYPWGEEWHERAANTDESGLERTSAVGIFPEGASKQEIEDLAGNVWEWCLNKYDSPSEIRIDWSEDCRVARGGSWEFGPDGARSAARDYWRPDSRNDLIGFRVVCVSPIF